MALQDPTINQVLYNLSMCACMYTCVHKCVGQILILKIFLFCTPPCFLRQDLSINMELTHWLDWLTWELQAPAVSLSLSSTGVTGTCCISSFMWMLKIQAQVLYRTRAESVLLTETSPQAQFYFLDRPNSCFHFKFIFLLFWNFRKLH